MLLPQSMALVAWRMSSVISDAEQHSLTWCRLFLTRAGDLPLCPEQPTR